MSIAGLTYYEIGYSKYVTMAVLVNILKLSCETSCVIRSDLFISEERGVKINGAPWAAIREDGMCP